MLPVFTFGDLVLDVIAKVEGRLEADTDTPGEIRSAPGGSAANFAVWTARLGDVVRFACRVGNDLLGRALVADMRHEGVEVFDAVDEAYATSVLVLFSEGEQRHMMVPRGANHFLDAADIPEAAVRSSGWLHVTGYSLFWEKPARAAARAMDIARESGIPISFDPSSAGFIRRHGLKVPEGVVVLMPNRQEATALTGAESAEEAARLLGQEVPLVAVKTGPEGVLLCQNGRISRVAAVQPHGQVQDTTGAGDAWGAVFVSSIRKGLDPRAAALRAHRVASRVVTGLGARPSFPLDADKL